MRGHVMPNLCLLESVGQGRSLSFYTVWTCREGGTWLPMAMGSRRISSAFLWKVGTSEWENIAEWLQRALGSSRRTTRTLYAGRTVPVRQVGVSVCETLADGIVLLAVVQVLSKKLF